METKTQTTDAPTTDEQYFDARTIHGFEEANRGEGYPEDESRARMDARIKASRHY